MASFPFRGKFILITVASFFECRLGEKKNTSRLRIGVTTWLNCKMPKVRTNMLKPLALISVSLPFINSRNFRELQDNFRLNLFCLNELLLTISYNINNHKHTANYISSYDYVCLFVCLFVFSGGGNELCSNNTLV